MQANQVVSLVINLAVGTALKLLLTRNRLFSPKSTKRLSSRLRPDPLEVLKRSHRPISCSWEKRWE